MPHANRRAKALPKYCLHKQSGKAFVLLNGRQHMLGEYGSAESRERYGRILAEFNAAPATVAARANQRTPGATRGPIEPISIAILVDRYWAHVCRYYTKPDGTPSLEAENFYPALKILNRLYGDTLAGDFGPLSLKAVRDAMIRPDPPTKWKGWCRTYANRMTSRLKACFKWAVENEMVESSVSHGLAAVVGLRAGRSEARESEPVKPPPEAMVNMVLPHLPKPVRAMVELEGISGARGGELCIMRRADIDMSNEACWVYRPASHKTAHHGHAREVPLGRRCQEIILPFLGPDWNAYLFSPCHGGEGTHTGRRAPGERYTPASYRRAISRACDKAFPYPADLARGLVPLSRGRSRPETPAEWRKRLGEEKWAEVAAWRREHRFHPHQLRHAAATRLRKLFGLEAAGVVLGQKTMAATLIYAEQDRELAAKVMGQIG